MESRYPKGRDPVISTRASRTSEAPAKSPEQLRSGRATAMIRVGGLGVIVAILAIGSGAAIGFLIALLGVGLFVGGLVIHP